MNLHLTKFTYINQVHLSPENSHNSCEIKLFFGSFTLKEASTVKMLVR